MNFSKHANSKYESSITNATSYSFLHYFMFAIEWKSIQNVPLVTFGIAHWVIPCLIWNLQDFLQPYVMKPFYLYFFLKSKKMMKNIKKF